MVDNDDYIEPEEEAPAKRQVLTKKQLLPREEDNLPVDIGLRHATQALFYEYRHKTSSKIQAPYTLKPYDVNIGGKHYRSMYMEYMACDSEYEAAIKLLGSYSHWQRLVTTEWFSKYIEAWEAERNIRDEALARSILVGLTMAGNVTAAKTMFTNSKTQGRKAGRSTKGGARQPASGSAELDEMLGHNNK